MIHARLDYNSIQDATNATSIAEDEPVFVLRAKDKVASEVVRDWALRARNAGTERRTIDAVLIWADRMDAYRHDNYSGGDIPDVPAGQLFNEQ